MSSSDTENPVESTSNVEMPEPTKDVEPPAESPSDGESSVKPHGDNQDRVESPHYTDNHVKSSGDVETLNDPLSDVKTTVDSSDKASNGPKPQPMATRSVNFASESEHDPKSEGGIEFVDETDHKATWEKYRAEKKSVKKFALAIWPADEGFRIQAKIWKKEMVKNNIWYYEAAIFDLDKGQELLKCSKSGRQSRQTVLEALVHDLNAKMNEKDGGTSEVSRRSTAKSSHGRGTSGQKKKQGPIVRKSHLMYIVSDGRKR